MSWPVESVSVVRSIASLSPLLAKRTEALLALEDAWVRFVGNPSSVPSYTPPSSNSPSGLPSTAGGLPPIAQGETGQKKERLEIEGKKRPMIREGGNGWAVWRKWVDEIEWWEEVFNRADEAVRRKRRAGRFEATGAAFVTFENMAHAVSRTDVRAGFNQADFFTFVPVLQQIATQTTHAPTPDQCITVSAPEPRDSQSSIAS